MTQRSGGGFFEGLELGKEFLGILVERADAAFAAETQKPIFVKSVHGIVELVVGNKANLEPV